MKKYGQNIDKELRLDLGRDSTFNYLHFDRTVERILTFEDYT